MKKRALCALLCLCVLLCGCTAAPEKLTRYTYSFFGTFDTFMVLIGYAPDEETFNRAATLCESEFKRYHELFNAYNHSDTVNNIYELNNGAWKAPMTVTEDMMALLTRCRDMQQEMPNTVNIAMGRVLRLWHNAREDSDYDPLNAYLPDEAELQEAAKHCSMDDLVLDEEAMTVYYADPLLRLDVGAVAKGYAAGRVGEEIKAILPHFSLSAGGNLVVGDAPQNESGKWRAGVQDPEKAIISDDETNLTVIAFNDQALVTSGDYQRFFTVDGVTYHHIIDPVTLFPARHMHAVTILTKDSMEADFLSTAAFILPYEQSRELIDSREDTEALWVLADGTVEMTDGFAALQVEQ